MKGKAIICPGGYRSGSTTLCNALLDAGVYGGDRFLTHNEDREAWESNAGEHVSAREEKRLDETSSPYRYDVDPWYVKRLMEIRQKFENSGREWYFIKDPQIARAMKAYALVWPDAHYVVCDRENHQALLSQRAREKVGHIQIGHIRRRSMYMDNIWYYCMSKNLNAHVLSHAGMSTPESAKMEELSLNYFLGFTVPLIKHWKHHVNIRSMEDMLFKPPVSSGPPTACACNKPDACADSMDIEANTLPNEQEAPRRTFPQGHDE